MNTKISLIIVHWNTSETLKKQLQQLITSSNFQIIVVDNASDKPLAWIKKNFPQIELIENKYNRGYTFACNQGAMKAVGEWLLFLNPDVEIKPEIIFQMLSQAEKENLDACSPKVSKNYQKPLPSWQSLLLEFTPLHRLYNFMSLPAGRQVLKTLFGGCLLIKKKVLFDLGGWDERFFLWFEDSDLTKTLVDNDYKVGWINLPIKHMGGQSFNRLDYQSQRNIFFHSMDVFAKKHFSSFGQLIVIMIKKRYTSRKLLPILTNVVSITVPNINKNLLDSFFHHNPHLSGVDDEWIIVSSAIDNKDIWHWREKYPFVRFISIEKNDGFASTVNIGFRVSAGKWIGTVNDDVFLSKDWLKNLFTVKFRNIGSINPVIKKKSGEVESVGIKILPEGKALPITDNYLVDDRLIDNNYRSVDATNAAAVVYDNGALNKVGLFDERLGSYLEDIDLSLRLSRAGYKNIVSLKSSVIHIGQASSKKLCWQKNWLDFKNWILVILKNWGVKKIILNFPAIVLERFRNLSGLVKSFKN